MKMELGGKILVLQAHFDDAVLMAGGTLAGHEGKKIVYSACGNDHPSLSKDDQIEYLTEHHRFLQAIDAQHENSLIEGKTNRLESIPLIAHTVEIERKIREHKPSIIITHMPDMNHDHIRMFNAVQVATRSHDKNWFVPIVLLAEQPCTVHSFSAKEFYPTVFIPINIEKKIKLYKRYKTQVRGHRDTETIIALAKLRGSQCNSPTGYAEAFVPLRITL